MAIINGMPEDWKTDDTPTQDGNQRAIEPAALPEGTVQEAVLEND